MIVLFTIMVQLNVLMFCENVLHACFLDNQRHHSMQILHEFTLTHSADEIIETFVELTNNSEVMASMENKTASIVLFFANWCPHCLRIIPTWQKIKPGYNMKQVNGWNLYLQEVNCSEYGNSSYIDAIITTYNVKQFPTILLIVN